MSTLNKWLFAFFIFVSFSITTFAQQYHFKNYTAKDGLGSSIVNNIFQDSKGYIWFATQGGGVSRFDGARFENFTKDDGLISNNVTIITEDRTGNIWIGTAEGVSRYNGLIFTNYNEKNGLPQAIIFSIYVDTKNTVWMGFREGGIKYFDGNKFDSLTVNDGLPSNRIYAIKQDTVGNYWFSCSGGIAKYDGKKITNYSEEETLKGKKFFSAFADRKGNVWFGGVYGSGIVKYNGNSFSALDLPADVSGDLIGSIAQDKKGNVWFATNHGALKFSERQFSLFSQKEGLSVNDVLSVASDYEGNIWIGTQGGGVNFFNNEAFVNYTEKDGLPGNNVNCIVADPVEDKWFIGTPSNGLHIFKPGADTEFSVLSGIKEIEGINIFSLAFDSKGLLWIGAQEGVFVLEKNNNSFRLKKVYTKIVERDLVTALKIIQDNNGNHWIASLGSGVVFISQEEEKYFGTDNGFATDNIMTVFEDSKSTIWIGTLDAGVFKYNGKTFEQFSPQEGFPDKAVWSIAEDNNGNIYFGTGESGLCCFNGKNLKTYSAKNGICSNYINALEWDKTENCLWVGSEKGTNRIKFNDALEIETIRTFREQEGFKAFEINQNAILIDKGLVWFGSVNGLCRYDKKKDIPNPTPPRLQLTGVRLAYKTVDWNNYADSLNPQNNLPVDLKLSYKNNHLVFDFRALTTDDVQYTFILEGQDEEWSPLSRNTEASYSNITPGQQYMFKVKAVNSNGVWSLESIPFSFTINPPWWTTWWFRLSAVIIVIALIVVFVKGRERVLKDQNIKLEKTVVERTAEVVAQKDVILKEKKRSDDLLLNILPEEVAQELKDKGYADAKHFDDATVLFTDFKGFTAISEKLTPQELVKEIDECFKAFDRIIEKYDIEKIKTIGDSYMAAGGLPVPDENNTVKVVKAALEIRNYVIEAKKQKGEMGFDIRIGIHSGPVVAGIVGIKKFAYDIWGDAVNTASRMESSGETGKVNISGAVYEKIKDQFNCIYRGEIDAKGKGKVKMYFVEES